MKYDFDRVIPRENTDCVKFDLRDKVFGSASVRPMWVADMDFEVPPFIREAVIERAKHPVYGYTYRPPRFYEEVASWLLRRHNWQTDPSLISFSPGIVPALNMCVLAYTKPGERIVVQPPVYFPFFSAVNGHQRELVYNPLVRRGEGYEMDFEHLEGLFREGAKMLILSHPHNPVGRVWNREELEQLAGLCIRYGVLVLSDEIHSDLIMPGFRHIPLASLGKEIAALTVTCVAPSKTFNLAGMHSSALIFSDAALKKDYETVLEGLHVGSGNLFGMVAMEAAYREGEEWLDQLLVYLADNFSLLKSRFTASGTGVGITPLEATYLVWLDFSSLGMDDKALNEFIVSKAGLGLNDGNQFGPGGSGFQRMNIATPRQVLNEALDGLFGALSGL